jgi:heme exporter protein B
MLSALFKRDVRLAFRHRGGALMGAQFFTLCFLLFAFALGTEALAAHAPGVLGACLLLSLTLSLPHLFERDEEDGTLEQYLLLPLAAEWLALTKIAAYWSAHALPLMLLSPVFMVVANMQTGIAEAMLRLFLTSVSVVSLAALGAALTLKTVRGALARAVILFPFYVPPLIFCAAPGEGSMAFMLLAAYAFASLPLSCFASGALLKD